MHLQAVQMGSTDVAAGGAGVYSKCTQTALQAGGPKSAAVLRLSNPDPERSAPTWATHPPIHSPGAAWEGRNMTALNSTSPSALKWVCARGVSQSFCTSATTKQGRRHRGGRRGGCEPGPVAVAA
jgi:hypothetical protein